MYTLEKIKQKIAQKVNYIFGSELVVAGDLSYPSNSEFGDISLPCFVLAKKIGKPVGEIASMIISGLEACDVFISVQAVGPYVNFTLNKINLAQGVIEEINANKENYGTNQGCKGQKVMVEYSNVNTHKEFHIGHLRNLCFGDSVSRILRANGAEVKPISYINDFGIHVAKTIWAYLEYYKNQELPENRGAFLGQIYSRASKELVDDQVAKGLVGLIMKKIEARSGDEYALWQKTREWSIEQLGEIYKEMGVLLNNSETLYESDFIDRGRELVDELLNKGILIHSQGAVIADLESENLGVLMFLRSDGTALYPVADLSLAKEKFDRFGLTKSIYVIDVRQSQHFNQLFSVLRKMGYNQEMVHLGYDFVKLPGGMMSSRTGVIITYEELKQEATNRVIIEIKKRHDDWSEEKINKTAWLIVSGAIKFEMLKVGSDQVITFDYDSALRFDGYTSAYLQYTGARINSILRKSGEVDNTKLDLSKLIAPEEHGLLLALAKYPEIVHRAGENYDPSEICKYLFSLAQSFNDYYHAISVLNSEDDVKKARLSLLAVVRQVLENGLDLLGIELLEEM